MTSHRDRSLEWNIDGGTTRNSKGNDDTGNQDLYLMKRPEDALRFGHWPGRLFEAEPVGTVIEETEFILRCTEVRLKEELDPAHVLGSCGSDYMDFIRSLKHDRWLSPHLNKEDAIELADQYQDRLRPWGWEPVPSVYREYFHWNDAAEEFSTSKDPAASCGAWIAWSTVSIDWHAWAVPWVSAESFRKTWENVATSAGGRAWDRAKVNWTGESPWPAPGDPVWQDTSKLHRRSTRFIAGAAGRDATRMAEYLLCSDKLPPNPFKSLVDLWGQGYFPIGVIENEYVVGDLKVALGG